MESFVDVDGYVEASTLWPAEIKALRPLLLAAGLEETIKWGKPCYAHSGENLAIVQEMKGFLALLFTKGALIPDPAGLLEQQGPNTRSARRLCLTSTSQIADLASVIADYVEEAKLIIDNGTELAPSPPAPWAAELQDRLDRDAGFRRAFGSLTPGRQREYNIYFTGAKQSTTRQRRVEKVAPRILEGKGLRDR